MRLWIETSTFNMLWCVWNFEVGSLLNSCFISSYVNYERWCIVINTCSFVMHLPSSHCNIISNGPTRGSCTLYGTTACSQKKPCSTTGIFLLVRYITCTAWVSHKFLHLHFQEPFVKVLQQQRVHRGHNGSKFNLFSFFFFLFPSFFQRMYALGFL